MRTITRLPAAAAMAAALGACGDADPTALSEEMPAVERTIKQAPSFAMDIQEIIVRTGCGDGGCHGSGQGSLFLGADVEANYRALVNVSAVTETQFLLVEPFDAENSYVIMRFEDRQAEGLPRMPVGPPLDSIDLANWRNWIDQGAANN